MACQSAAQVAQAIVDGDHATVVELSWSDRFDCSALDAAMFPGCTSGDELVGYAFGTAAGTIDVLSADAFMARLDSVTRSIDPEFRDETGDGRARVLGTSTCGPEDPSRRSHYVAWAVAASDAGGPAERQIGL